MAKKVLAKATPEILDQVTKAKQALASLEQLPQDGHGEFQEAVTVRALLNAAKAHVIRAIEKAQMLG
ncbi:MAG: hypothetical protein HQL93_01885 [Magnetococcales bacterium]|nr:hypothetical protein [Magnetococcales bacterium]